jgi:AraC-like DNA-binding protein
MKIDHVAFHHAVSGSWGAPAAPIPHHILLLVTQGSFIYKMHNQTIDVSKGDVLFLPQGTVRIADVVHAGLNIMYSAHFSDLSLSDLSPFLDEPYKRLRPIGYNYLKQRFSMLNECWIGKMPGYELMSRGILLEILGFLQRDLGSGNTSPAHLNLALRIQQHIVKHYREQLRIDDLARELDRSPSYISTVFKEITGKTPIEYMHEVRISAARELLQTSNMTIGQISESLGYCDQTYFNYIYKKFVGQPPSHSLRVRNRF